MSQPGQGQEVATGAADGAASKPGHSETGKNPLPDTKRAEQEHNRSRTAYTPGGVYAGGASARTQPVEDPDLRRILDAWPTLPGPLRAAVLALIGAAQEPTCLTPLPASGNVTPGFCAEAAKRGERMGHLEPDSR